MDRLIDSLIDYQQAVVNDVSNIFKTVQNKISYNQTYNNWTDNHGHTD